MKCIEQIVGSRAFIRWQVLRQRFSTKAGATMRADKTFGVALARLDPVLAGVTINVAVEVDTASRYQAEALNKRIRNVAVALSGSSSR